MHTTTRICISTAKNSRGGLEVGGTSMGDTRHVGTLSVPGWELSGSALLRFRDRGVSGDLETPRMRANVSLLIPRRHLPPLALARARGYKSARIRDGLACSACCPFSSLDAQAHASREECKCRARGHRYSYPTFPSNLSLFALNVIRTGARRILAMPGIFKHLSKFPANYLAKRQSLKARQILYIILFAR